VCLAVAGPAAAQSEAELARARAAFGAGVEASDAGRWEEAAARFRQVMEVRATGQVKYNLAVALEHTGELAEAAELLADVVDDRELGRRTRRDARRLLSTIQPRLGRLTVMVSGDDAGTRVTLDGDELAAESIGSAVTVDPGMHSVVLARGGTELDRESVSVPEGGTASVTLTAAAPVPTPAEVALDAETAGDPRSDDTDDGGGGSVFGEWWFWTGVAALVIGVALIGIIASSGDDGEPVQGNLRPGILEVSL